MPKKDTKLREKVVKALYSLDKDQMDKFFGVETPRQILERCKVIFPNQISYS